MRAKAFRLVFLVAVLSGSSACNRKPDSPKPDNPKPGGEPQASKPTELDGVWRAVSSQTLGEKEDPGILKTMRFTFAGDRLTRDAGALRLEQSCRVDPSRNPKQIDLTYTGGLLKGSQSKGIYRLEGDTLTLCTGQKRPDKFASSLENGCTLIVLKRDTSRPRAREEAKRLEGTWEVTGVEAGGKPAPGERPKQLTFQDGKVEGLAPGMTYEVEPDLKPLGINLFTKRKIGDTVISRGIYSLDRDTLKLCIPLIEKGKGATAKRADSFDTKDKPLMLVTAKRQK